MIWTGGVKVDPLISSLNCEHGPSGRIVVDKFLRVKGFDNVFALGDCALMLERKNSEPLPPTAQIAIKEYLVKEKFMDFLHWYYGDRFIYLIFQTKRRKLELGRMVFRFVL